MSKTVNQQLGRMMGFGMGLGVFVQGISMGILPLEMTTGFDVHRDSQKDVTCPSVCATSHSCWKSVKT